MNSLDSNELKAAISETERFMKGMPTIGKSYLFFTSHLKRLNKEFNKLTGHVVEPDTLKCCKCKKNMPLNMFCKSKTLKRGYQYACQNCRRQYRAAQRLKKQSESLIVG